MAHHRRQLVSGALVVLAGFVLARRRSLRWGATGDEVVAPLPGDDLLRAPDLQATRAVAVRAPAAEVWPWVAQMGQGRGGLYSYDWLENLVGCEMRSADVVVPWWQDIAVGDDFRLHPQVALTVVHVEPGRALVVRGGVPASGSTTDGAPAPYDFTWAFVLVPADDDVTRLVVRERYAYRTTWAAPLVETVEWISLLMTERMLRGIRDRAEGAWHAEQRLAGV